MRDAIKYSDRVIMLDQGKIILDKESRELSEKELTDIYTEKLNIFNEKRNSWLKKFQFFSFDYLFRFLKMYLLKIL